MTMGHGTPAIQEALDHGVRPSLSSDHGVTHRAGLLHAHAIDLHVSAALFRAQRARNGEQNLPPLLTCRDVLEFATIEGARCANLDGKVGTLTPGKEADIVMLRADRLDVWPLNNAPGTVVNLMNPGHVETVFIAGKVKKWRGNLVGVDEPRVLRLVQEARDAVMRRAGFQINSSGLRIARPTTAPNRRNVAARRDHARARAAGGLPRRIEKAALVAVLVDVGGERPPRQLLRAVANQTSGERATSLKSSFRTA